MAGRATRSTAEHLNADLTAISHSDDISHILTDGHPPHRANDKRNSSGGRHAVDSRRWDLTGADLQRHGHRRTGELSKVVTHSVARTLEP
jgi:hypothetical protein